ncbi:MAG: hypothetical protein ABIH68_05035 [bacterium]
MEKEDRYYFPQPRPTTGIFSGIRMKKKDKKKNKDVPIFVDKVAE